MQSSKNRGFCRGSGAKRNGPPPLCGEKLGIALALCGPLCGAALGGRLFRFELALIEVRVKAFLRH